VVTCANIFTLKLNHFIRVHFEIIKGFVSDCKGGCDIPVESLYVTNYLIMAAQPQMLVLYGRLSIEQATAVLLESKHNAHLVSISSKEGDTSLDDLNLRGMKLDELVVTNTCLSAETVAKLMLKLLITKVTILVHSVDAVDLYMKSYGVLIPDISVVELGAYVAAQDPPELVTHMVKFHRKGDSELIYDGFRITCVGVCDMFEALRDNLFTADIDALREAGRDIGRINRFNAQVFVKLKAYKVTVCGLDARIVCASDYSVMAVARESAKETGVGVVFRYDTAQQKTRVTVVVETERVDSSALFQLWKSTPNCGGRPDVMGGTFPGYLPPLDVGSDLLSILPHGCLARVVTDELGKVHIFYM
jgi:hypothetical protein